RCPLRGSTGTTTDCLDLALECERSRPPVRWAAAERDQGARCMSDILEIAREQVLERGRGLDREQVLAVLPLPDERVPDALALAHEVRMRWCGPAVEVEGIVSIKTGGCPEDCHFCSPSGRFPSPVRSVRLDIPALVRAA